MTEKKLPGLAPHGGRPRPEDSPTRRPVSFWDRIKILLLLGVVFALFVAAILEDFQGIMPLGDAIIKAAQEQAWILVLASLEVLRQLHYLISENSERYHHYWGERSAAWNRRMGGMNDWTRYRIGRVLRILAFLAILDLILAQFLDVSPAVALFEAPRVLFQAMPLIFQLAFAFFFIVFQFVGLFWFLSRGGIDTYMPDDINTRFSDVWGQDNVLKRVEENVLFLEQPEKIEERGGYVPGGILLWGPPGTGKTMTASAVAGETGKPFVQVDAGAFINMFMGVGILKVKGLFRKLRKLALRYGGVIVFFDEADSLGNRGALAGQGGPWGGMSAPAPWSTSPSCNGMHYLSPYTVSMLQRENLQATAPTGPQTIRDRVFMGGMAGGGGAGTLQALLSELDGLKKPRGFMNRIVRRALGMKQKPPPKYRILVIMATNMPEALDPAMLRPGRIDRIYKVGYPSKVGRVRTYQGYFDKVRHQLSAEDIDKLATITPYATGATIKDLVNEALTNAIRDDRQAITWKDVVKAKQLKDLGPPEDVEYIERERHAVAVHEACHAVVAYRIRQHLLIDIATIEKGGSYLGMVASIPPEDQFTRWRSEYEADVMTSLASLAGERMFFDGDNSSGVSGDLENSTKVATLMEGYWGMGSTVTSHGVTHEVGIGGGGRPGDRGDRKKREKDLLDTDLGGRIEEKLQELLARAQEILMKNRREVLAVAHALEAHKTVTGDDVEAIIEGREGPLIDGRAYHQKDFLKQAEDYHKHAIAAHKTHSRIAAPLPVVSVELEPEAVAATPAPKTTRRRKQRSIQEEP